MSTWRVARSLETLRAQLDDIAPNRSRASDGAIGDAAHATRDSDHNPWYVLAGQPLVTARDFTHDPAGGLDCARLADVLTFTRDSRVKYVIWARRIMSGPAGPQPWRWRAYSGANPHTHHLHVSVVADARADSAIPWRLWRDPATLPTLRYGDRGTAVAQLQRFCNAYDWTPDLPLLPVTGYYGDQTVRVVALAQAQCGVTGSDADGTIVGPRTNAAFAARGYRG
ncbi:MAG: peptidoglycan-binding protein [Burkholderiales bacterium]